MSQQIVLVEDDEDIAELIHYNFEAEGYSITTFQDGQSALEALPSNSPDVIILDIMLPGISGLDLLKNLRAQDKFSSTPIIMLTAKGEEFDVVLGLELGADDYMTKPFSPKELIARTKAVLRRANGAQAKESETITVSGITIDKARHVITIDGKETSFTLSEFKLLKALAEAHGKVLTRDQLINQIAGESTFVIDRNVDVHIRSVRKKLGEQAEIIETVRGVGYRCRA